MDPIVCARTAGLKRLERVVCFLICDLWDEICQPIIRIAELVGKRAKIPAPMTPESNDRIR